jgi:hypothetical protein
MARKYAESRDVAHTIFRALAQHILARIFPSQKALHRMCAQAMSTYMAHTYHIPTPPTDRRYI